MKKYIIPIVIFLISTAHLFSNVDSVSQILKSHVKYLSSDSLEGRFPGLKSMQLSENYLIDNLKNYGVQPLSGSYKQTFEVTTGMDIGQENNVQWQSLIIKPGVPKEYATKVKRSWKLKEDYIPMAMSENGKVSGEVVFAGFGISAPELNYDDYANIDVKDKIVVLLSDNPESNKENSDFDNYNGFRYKISNAKRKGAKGIIFVRIEGDSMNIFYPLSYSFLGKNTGMIVIQANRHSVDKFFSKRKKLFDLEKAIRAELKPQSYQLKDCTVEINVDISERKTATSNIVGIIEGKNPSLKNEYVIIGAHYDHLGYGGPSSRYAGKKYKIHNGADDNASGTAGLLELASRIAGNPLERSVLFVAFTAEEMGTLGSTYFVKSSLFNKKNTQAMINMDMIGKLSKKEKELTIFGTNSSNDFIQLFEKINSEDINLKITKQSFGASDHAPFLRDSVPVLSFFTGIHGDYHTPDDDWQKLNYRGQANVINVIYDAVRLIANYDDKISFNNEVLTKEKSGAKHHGYSNVWFGIVPSFEESELGFKIAGTSPGSPAQKAGLQKNDIITQINDNAIDNIYDFMYSLKGGKPGDKMEVIVLRGKDLKEHNLTVTLAPRNK